MYAIFLDNIIKNTVNNIQRYANRFKGTQTLQIVKYCNTSDDNCIFKSFLVE